MLTRREFIMGASALLASTVIPGCKRPRSPVPGATSSERAVLAARKYAGVTLHVGWETGPQAEDLLRFSGPRWQELTGIRIDVVELGLPTDTLERLLEEHRKGTRELDCASVAPSWMPDLVRSEVLLPLDDRIAQFGVASDRADLLPGYRALGSWNQRTYGLFDDGDALLVYYRKDLFADPAIRRSFSQRFGCPLGDPQAFDWSHLLEVARFFTERQAPHRYGMAPFNRDLSWAWFQAYFRAHGGQFFDPVTMKPAINTAIGLRTMDYLVALMRTMPPALDQVSTIPALATYLTGHAAMATFWPPLGRWAEGHGQGSPGLSGVPPTQVAGRTGYALLPGGVTELAVGYMLAVMAGSRHPEAAYLFIQWLNSPEISLQRVMLPYALRDPFRRSQIRAPAYRSLWPTAPDYLDLLERAAPAAFLDLTLPGATQYQEAFHVALTSLRLGSPPAGVLDRMAADWDGITDRLGRRSQATAYADFLARPGAMPLSGRNRP